MITYPQAYSSDDDSIEFMLLNATWFWLYDENDRLDITYRRDDSKKNKMLSYAELSTISPSLPKLLEYMSNKYDRAGNELFLKFKGTIAHLLGCTIDLEGRDYQSGGYRYVSHIEHVRSARKQGEFLIKGLNFYVKRVDDYTIPIAELSSAQVQLITSDTMEHIWPGSSVQVPIMEALGYTDEEIVKTLTTAPRNSIVVSEGLNDVGFD